MKKSEKEILDLINDEGLEVQQIIPLAALHYASPLKFPQFQKSESFALPSYKEHAVGFPVCKVLPLTGI
jgi:hypothetical protein